MTRSPTDAALQLATARPLQSAAEVFELLNVPRLLGFAVGAFLVAAAGAAAYRWYVNEPVPQGLTTLLGTATIAVYLNTVGLFSTVIPVAGVAATDPFAPMTVLPNVVSLLIAAGATPVGRRAGDAFAINVTVVAGGDRVEGELSRFARSVGRIRSVDLPDSVADIDGYDPVDAATKERLAGETLLFPRRLSEGELRDRLISRLKTEYGVGHVDVEFDGTEVARLGVGRRVAGLGPTLEPTACAVAIRADPPNGAGPGDVVQVWKLPEDPVEQDAVAEADGGATERRAQRVTTAELRATAGDVVTLAVDAADHDLFDPAAEYRLLTMPTSPRIDREFASLLRVADETMGVATIGAGSDLDGSTVASVSGTVVAVEPVDGTVDPIPGRSRTLQAGETLYLVARPDVIREVERKAASPASADSGSADGSDGSGSDRSTDD